MNPRYLAYCRANRNSPEQQKAIDTEAYPGGKMCGFMLWISQQVRAFTAECPQHLLNGEIANHAAFTAWIEARFPLVAA